MTPATPPNNPPTSQQLLSPDFMRQLDRIDLLSRKVLSGKMQGERRSKRRGRSVEFADYRAYAPGDDPRFIDWNLYARLDRLFLRLFMEEEDLAVSILLDVSRSMDFGQPNKLMHAKCLAASMAYLALVHHNRVHLYSFGQSLEGQLPNLRGRRPMLRALDFLDKQRPSGAGDLAAAFRAFALAQRNKGMVIVISDMLDKGDPANALRYLAGERYDTYMIHVLSPEELDPSRGSITGDLRLVDAEDAHATEVSITPALMKQYHANVTAWRESTRALCHRRGAHYLSCDSSVPVETVVLQYLRRLGLIG